MQELKLKNHRTVALIISDCVQCDVLTLNAVKSWTTVGTEWFLIWGKSAEPIEDALDYFLIDLGLGGTPTMSFAHESFRDTIEFAMHAVFFGEDSFRLIIIADASWSGYSEIFEVLSEVSSELGVEIVSSIVC
jgi:hypothetical protein